MKIHGFSIHIEFYGVLKPLWGLCLFSTSEMQEQSACTHGCCYSGEEDKLKKVLRTSVFSIDIRGPHIQRLCSACPFSMFDPLFCTSFHFLLNIGVQSCANKLKSFCSFFLQSALIKQVLSFSKKVICRWIKALVLPWFASKRKPFHQCVRVQRWQPLSSGAARLQTAKRHISSENAGLHGATCL